MSWYLRYPLSYRDVEELLLERSLEIEHSTVNRWVLACTALIERRLRPFRKSHCGSVRSDETYVRIRGGWRYLWLEVVRRNPTAVGFEVIRRRWIVERTFSWLGRNRRLAKNFEDLASTLLVFVTLAAIQLGIRRLART